jgi:hypothetical protein
MRLGLSAAAAPEARLDELLEACDRRGLLAVELLPGASGFSLAAPQLSVGAGHHAAAVAGILIEDAADHVLLAGASRTLGVPIIVGGTAAHDERVSCARRIRLLGGAAHALLSGPAAAWVHLLGESGESFAWQLDDTCSDPVADSDRLLAWPGALQYIRLVGGGPEAAMHEGRGIGAVMGRLTLAGYSGPLVLAPGSPRYRIAWSMWLGRRGGFGCGSKAGAPAPLPLTAVSGERS